MNATIPSTTNGVKLVNRVVCPHCWQRFAPEDVLWISEHLDLFGDSLLPEQQQRFLPSRFTPGGDAIDARGQVCRGLACPQCHLPVPRGLLELEPLFFSILGAPASGKSFLLAAATWKLREVMTESFSVAFQDADPSANRALNDAEDSLFHSRTPDRIARFGDLISKTALEGDLYDTVRYGQQSVTYPRPYLFSIQPLDRHPGAMKGGLDRILCLYDNAGEHWKPGYDTTTSPVTRHLAMAKVLIYLFDPMQDRQFRDEALRKGMSGTGAGEGFVARQETILNEAATRIRSYTGLAQNAKIDRPLIVVVSKFDAWSHLLGYRPADDPWKMSPTGSTAGFHTELVEQVSGDVQKLLAKHCRATVNAAEALSRQVIYIPVSAVGERIEADEETGLPGIRPGAIEPFWVTVPFLYAIQAALPGMIPKLVRKSKVEARRGAS